MPSYAVVRTANGNKAFVGEWKLRGEHYGWAWRALRPHRFVVKELVKTYFTHKRVEIVVETTDGTRISGRRAWELAGECERKEELCESL